MVTPSFATSVIKKTADYGEFALEPLEQSYGQTLGNALRRVLLTSLEGAAITQVKIEGVKHQFTTLGGLKEDIVELILNLKQIRLAYQGEKPETLTLKVSGPKEVTAADIKGPATVKIVNPEQPICSLADKSSQLNITLTVERGMGYSPAEERKVGTVGLIPVDAVFSPVNRVAYSVEATRVGRRTDFDKLIMKIWTDGTLEPQSALDQAAQILVDFFKQIYQPVVKEAVETVSTSEPVGEVYHLTVEELELPTRIANALRKGGYKTVKHIIEADPVALAKVKNLGEKSITKVALALKKRGLSLKGA